MAFVAAELVKALRTQLVRLEDDLRARVDGDDVAARQEAVAALWRAEHAEALSAQRTAASWQAWRDERVTQSAVAWLLLTVFARYCEDNTLVSKAWIGGPDADSRQEALDARGAYFAAHREHSDRDWLKTIAEHFATLDATQGLVDSFSPLHQVAPSGDAARELLEFWWDKGAEGEPRWSFTGVDTRFLGDVYQDLSEFAKQTYALLQTPEFVEEFILDQTLEPALDERPLNGFTVIDPTCGSGHFLLGAFHRLLDRWQREAPALGQRVLVQRALESVYGVDINPFAVAIARFRLLVEALHASGDKSIEKLIDIKLKLATGDSLLWGARQQALDDDMWGTGQERLALSTEDAEALKAILQREHDAVVGNPPYIVVKDSALNQTYRQLYSTCHRQYALTVPFMELFHDLAKGGVENPGWVGQITSNSFMKREFGSKLIEEFLVTRDLKRVIDTSGAYIPGHGTPTVIILGRNRSPVGDTVRAVLGVRGEPGRPDEPAKGLVWSAIVDHVDEPGFESDWISVADLPRASLGAHPWSLSGGGAPETLKAIEEATNTSLRHLQKRIGFFGDSHADEIFFLPDRYARRLPRSPALHSASRGDEVRDWDAASSEVALLPYSDGGSILSLPAMGGAVDRYLWRFRTTLGSRSTFGGGTYFTSGRDWYAWHQLPRDEHTSELSITFAFVATHNHFVLDRGGKVFNRSAPVIKLPEGASEDDHLRLLGVLNSSVACFWLKQVCHDKGSQSGSGGFMHDEWEVFYEFTGTNLKNFPLPSSYPLERTRILDNLAQKLDAHAPAAIAVAAVPTSETLETARSGSQRIRALMIAQQEELDWECYRLYGLIDEDLTHGGELPGIALGERAFEIALARALADSESTVWFERHQSTPVTEIPEHLPAVYRDLIQRRLVAIASNPVIHLLERPEHKRRWASDPWDKRVNEALRHWLLDRIENRDLWFEDGHPTPRSVAQLADRLDRDEDFRQVLRMWAGSPDVSTGAALEKLLADEGVPYLAAWRYKPSGLTKREAWEQAWELQRREDAGEKLDAPIPVPPNYRTSDFLKTSYWSRRGKLDVPKERFIAYPGAGRDSDPTMLLGWAGWDHAEQALALAGVIDERISADGWDQTSRDKLVPMLAGLAELLPWVRQWHGEVDPEFGESVADTIGEVLRSHSTELGIGPDELAAWRPPAASRGRRTRKTKTEDSQR